jgi:hypothetical protein
MTLAHVAAVKNIRIVTHRLGVSCTVTCLDVKITGENYTHIMGRHEVIPHLASVSITSALVHHLSNRPHWPPGSRNLRFTGSFNRRFISWWSSGFMSSLAFRLKLILIIICQ